MGVLLPKSIYSSTQRQETGIGSAVVFWLVCSLVIGVAGCVVGVIDGMARSRSVFMRENGKGGRRLGVREDDGSEDGDEGGTDDGGLRGNEEDWRMKVWNWDLELGGHGRKRQSSQRKHSEWTGFMPPSRALGIQSQSRSHDSFTHSTPSKNPFLFKRLSSTHPRNAPPKALRMGDSPNSKPSPHPLLDDLSIDISTTPLIALSLSRHSSNSSVFSPTSPSLSRIPHQKPHKVTPPAEQLNPLARLERQLTGLLMGHLRGYENENPFTIGGESEDGDRDVESVDLRSEVVGRREGGKTGDGTGTGVMDKVDWMAANRARLWH